MAAFRYRAIDAAGRPLAGVMAAASREEVLTRLREAGSLPVDATPARRWTGFAALLHADLAGPARLGAGERAEFTRELATLLAAGGDLDRALRFLVETAPGRNTRAVFERLRERVRDGAALADALVAEPASFPELYVGMVRAGEAGAALAPTLERLAQLLEHQRSLAATVQSALIYPALLLLTAIGSIAFLLTGVLPRFVPLFAQSGVPLPAPTRVLMAVGAAVSAWGPLALAVLLALFLATRVALRRPGPRLVADRLVLRLPLAGALLREALAARFTRALGTLLVNGVPLVAALSVVEGALGNRAAAAALRLATRAAKDGAGLARPLAAARLFPARTVHLLRLGEETAQLGPLALRAADIHEERTRLGVQRMVALLVPAVTIVMGAAVAGIVAALLLAMLRLNDLAH